jgi:hypothetical protein
MAHTPVGRRTVGGGSPGMGTRVEASVGENKSTAKHLFYQQRVRRDLIRGDGAAPELRHTVRGLGLDDARDGPGHGRPQRRGRDRAFGKAEPAGTVSDDSEAMHTVAQHGVFYPMRPRMPGRTVGKGLPLSNRAPGPPADPQQRCSPLCARDFDAMPTGRFLLCFVGATGLGVPACTPAPDAAWPVAVTLVDSVTGVMPTTFPGVVALRSGPVCVPDTYLHKVRCFDPASREWTAFGREGSGPGEFRALGPLVRMAGRDSLIGVVDIRHNRFSVHDADGLYHGGYSVPPLFQPISEVGPRALSGLWVSYTPTEHRTGRLARLDAETGASLAQITMEERVGAGESTAGFARGVELDDGTMVLNITRDRFARFSADGHKLADLELPDHLRAPIYPTERDIEVFRYELRRLFGILDAIPEDSLLGNARDSLRVWTIGGAGDASLELESVTISNSGGQRNSPRMGM